MATAEVETKLVEVKPPPTKRARRRASAAKRKTAAASKKTTAARRKTKTTGSKTKTAATPRKREVKPGMPTKRPADLSKAAKQPPAGEIPSKTLIAKGRSDYGIEPYFTGALVPIRPAARGAIIHAKKDPHTTLCEIDTDMWVGGQKKDEEHEVNCLWCLARAK